jgi:enoyl-[acyl-carrier protein] reductase I
VSFLDLKGRTFLVLGFANRKSVAWHIARTLDAEGARVVHAVRSEKRRSELLKLLPEAEVLVCDVEHPEAATRLAANVAALNCPLDGFVHSIAFANYSQGFVPFHQTVRSDFLQAAQISAFSLVELAGALKPHFSREASVVTIGISSLDITPDNYGYMGPVKAMLDSCVRFLAKSFSHDTAVRFNSVGAGPLKTSASAGIPGYLESYLYAEKMTLRKRNLATQEVADVAAFLLSRRSSGINGTTLVVDAGLGQNTFDRDMIRLAMRPEQPPRTP